MSVGGRNIKLLLEAVTYMAIMKTVTCIITTEIVMCIMHFRNNTCMFATEIIISIKKMSPKYLLQKLLPA